MNDIMQLLGGIQLSQEIPAIWFEIFKLQYICKNILSEKTEEEQKEMLNGAVNFSFEQVKKRFPKLEVKLTFPEEAKE